MVEMEHSVYIFTSMYIEFDIIDVFVICINYESHSNNWQEPCH